MQLDFKKFLNKIIVFTIIVAAIQFAVSRQLPAIYVSNSWPVIVFFFAAFTTIMHHYLLKSTLDNPKRFIFSFMMFTTIKILLYLAVILIYVLLNRLDAVAFIFAFFTNYFLFTIFEISSVLKYLKQNQSKPE